ncbi:Trehalose/maltose import ATP-binding protein MalK [Candidatus Gugararchaeum adminiculabundum]|nr:Trehalose/maltose import ATP-binding protein MalK [Candidatus Gugararchaeum adminiculabundum]
MASADSVIITNQLTRKFGELTAVNGLNLEIKKGEIFGLLGPNGAGKTTTISMLTGMLRPTSGSASVHGFDVLHETPKVRKSIGIVFQEPSVDDLLTGRENLQMHALLYGIPASERKSAIDKMLKLVELEERADSLVRTYSGGMRRRLEIARGIMHRPKVLFLDEPTLGLDPQSRQHIWDHIKQLRDETGLTIVLTTHYMDEADLLCDRIMIVDKGKQIALGTPEQLKQNVGHDLVTLKIKNPNLPALQKLGFISGLKQRDGTVTMSVTDIAKNMQKLLNAAGEIESVEVHRVTLNDVFLHYAGHGLEDEHGEGGYFEREMQSQSNRK